MNYNFLFFLINIMENIKINFIQLNFHRIRRQIFILRNIIFRNYLNFAASNISCWKENAEIFLFFFNASVCPFVIGIFFIALLWNLQCFVSSLTKAFLPCLNDWFTFQSEVCQVKFSGFDDFTCFG